MQAGAVTVLAISSRFLMSRMSRAKATEEGIHLSPRKWPFPARAESEGPPAALAAAHRSPRLTRLDADSTVSFPAFPSLAISFPACAPDAHDASHVTA